MLFATDLDRTIIYSNKFVENYQTVSCVEHLDGREISYMSHRALELLAKVKNRSDIHLLPITTRSLAQFSRIIPLQDCPYAVVANGGIILHNGQPLKVWQEHIERTRQIQALDYPKILDILTKYQKYLTRTPSLVDNLFFFTKVTEDQDIVQEFILPSLEKDLKNLEWTFTLQGLKLYIIPKEISKENALSFLQDYLKEEFLITSGDGKLDAGFLSLGDIKMIPKNSEVYQLIDNKDDYMIVNQGIEGAEDILSVVLEQKT
ncbi:hypothetical protein J1C86_06815 [Streptococcus sanguinis]|uniref:HAD family hydrolase n=2 Tax=Streptococcus sanguinis TaxID=1305 RepID=UPI000F66A6A3|nr:HAD family hydrolase [Streptococcus sanguinis]RSI21567.1 haloacid dehalogenase-like hydrolase [Streptococcus sanguinis]